MSHQTNPNGVCHGGMLATFCDVHMSIAAVYQHSLAPRLLPTVSLSLDFLQPIPLGAWVEGRAQLLRAGRRLAFIQDLLTVDGVPAVRASGTFSVPSSDTGGEEMRARFRQLLGL
ncbi:MAG: PaaI family thioesterase [Caulobacteraceae bacterium]